MPISSLHFDHEDRLGAHSPITPCIVGVDEVGYGAWAGEIVIAAAWINRDTISHCFLNQLDDSKKLSPKKRLYLCDLFIQNPIWGSYALVSIPASQIVQGLVLRQTLSAMVQAVKCLDQYLGGLAEQPLWNNQSLSQTVPFVHWKEEGASNDFLTLTTIHGVIVDGRHGLPMNVLQTQCPGGDGQSYSVALASIIAKVARDHKMSQLHLEHPLFLWDQNKGYGTRAHQNAISQNGLSPYHRPFYCKRALG